MIKVREDAFRYYFFFMQERMKLFWNKYSGESIYPVTDDVITQHRFTNVYRATDRVSQYLIKDLIYSSEHDLDAESLLLNVLIFKVFNRVDTWNKIISKCGYFDANNFNPSKASKILSQEIKEGPIFNAAYIMTASSDKYRYLDRKHERWLAMIDKEIIKPGVLRKILGANSMEEVYNLLYQCTFIGPFLAYQYTIDFNYSSAIDFDENSFVMAGIGAQRGIKKCFIDLDGYSYEDAIRYTQENILSYRNRYGYEFRGLFNRDPTLIDLQNCFCETDKILRVRIPDLSEGNKRIKQKYKVDNSKIDFFFPPKWQLLK